MSDLTPITCAECRRKTRVGDNVFLLDRTTIAIERLDSSTAPTGSDYVAPFDMPDVLCSHKCLLKRVQNSR